MRTNGLCIVLLMLFSITFNNIFSQGDYFVRVNGDSVCNITITGYPAKGVINVNGYNSKLYEKYEDLNIVYKTSTGEESNEYYNRVKVFCINGKRITTWHARNIPLNAEGKIEFNKVIEIEGKTKEQLYTVARSWIISKLGLTADAIDKYLVEDREAGIITISNLIDGKNTITPYDSPPFSNWIMYTITIRVRDNRSKVTLGNFSCHFETGKIFDNKYVESNDVTAENVVNNWRVKSAINSHLYQGLLLMFYLAEDVTMKEFEARLLQKEEDW